MLYQAPPPPPPEPPPEKPPPLELALSGEEVMEFEAEAIVEFIIIVCVPRRWFTSDGFEILNPFVGNV